MPILSARPPWPDAPPAPGRAGRHPFLSGNDLPRRWQGRTRFVILETGFGLGHNFLSTWQAWRHDPQACDHLIFLSVEKHPLTADDLRRVHREGPERDDVEGQLMVQQLVQRWPVPVEGWHLLDFEEPSAHGPAPRRITLQLGLGDVAQLLPGLIAEVDAFYLDGVTPGCDPDTGDDQWLSRLDRLAAPGATAATRTSARAVSDSLSRAGFTVESAPDGNGPHEMLTARFTPRHVPPPLPGGLLSDRALPAEKRQALVLGSGLAGCAAAWALTREGWTVQLLDRHPQPGAEASGNAGGLFHAIVHAEDGPHARAHRHAALHTATLIAPWIREGRLPGSADGLLRLEPRLQREEADHLLTRLGLPPEHVHWLDAEQARHLSGLDLPSGGWWLGQAGWVSPADLCQRLLDEAAATGGLVRLPPGQVAALRPPASPPAAAPTGSAPTDGPPSWAVLDARGEVLGSAPVLVLANAGNLPALLESLPPSHAVAVPPLSRIRGQTTLIAPHAGLRPPRLPVAGGGYALTLPDGRVLCGATTLHHDDDPSVRDSDHRHNLAQAGRLGVLPAPDPASALAHVDGGRTGWRATTPDRLPLVGALPWHPTLMANTGGAAPRWQARHVPRHRQAGQGLFVLGGLGSRGITWHVLAARLLAHWVCGTPCPVEADLRDALDPARFLVRDRRRATPRD